MNNQHQSKVLVGITDHFDPEVRAMLLAMYSRNYGPIESRLPTTIEEEKSLKQRLEKFYVGYGHKSVGQLGDTSIFFEGVSQLAAKAIEDNPLFNGQESSTRYIDFSQQPMIHFGDYLISALQEKWRTLYIKAVPTTIAMLKEQYPCPEPEKVDIWPGMSQEESDREFAAKRAKAYTTWENTIKARAFDICRSLLPAGVVTNVGYSGTFDNINDHFGAMLQHPSAEMVSLVELALNGLSGKYSHATPGVYKLRERFNYVSDAYFYNPSLTPLQHHLQPLNEGQQLDQSIKTHLLSRKKYQDLPKYQSARNRYRLGGVIDFGSFRDLHRHRNAECLMPLLTPTLGFNRWYLDNLPTQIAEQACGLIIDSVMFFENHPNEIQAQYAMAMGFNVNVDYECNLNQTLYLMELRTDKTVHQTLRHYMQKCYSDFCDSNGLSKEPKTNGIYADLDEDNFTLRRGEQTHNGDFK